MFTKAGVNSKAIRMSPILNQLFGRGSCSDQDDKLQKNNPPA